MAVPVSTLASSPSLCSLQLAEGGGRTKWTFPKTETPRTPDMHCHILLYSR